jgi:DTW domain-containing protein YfiP
VDLETQLFVIMHSREWQMTTNTVRLASLIFPESKLSIRFRGALDLESDFTLPPGVRAGILYPSEDSIVLESLSDFDRVLPGSAPRLLVVPDGTWSQAARIYRRVPELAGLPRFRLPPGPPSRYQLRTEAHEGHVCTFEAISRALGVLEGSELREKLEAAFDLFVERRLISKGKLPFPPWLVKALA